MQEPPITRVSGTRPGLLDSAQRMRILRHPQAILLFATYDPFAASSSSTPAILPPSASKQSRTKRIVCEFLADGSFATWRFVPDARLYDGIPDEGTWPRAVDICGQFVYMDENQWDIYKLDPCYECLVGARYSTMIRKSKFVPHSSSHEQSSTTRKPFTNLRPTRVIPVRKARSSSLPDGPDEFIAPHSVPQKTAFKQFAGIHRDQELEQTRQIRRGHNQIRTERLTTKSAARADGYCNFTNVTFKFGCEDAVVVEDIDMEDGTIPTAAPQFTFPTFGKRKGASSSESLFREGADFMDLDNSMKRSRDGPHPEASRRQYDRMQFEFTRERQDRREKNKNRWFTDNPFAFNNGPFVPSFAFGLPPPWRQRTTVDERGPADSETSGQSAGGHAAAPTSPVVDSTHYREPEPESDDDDDDESVIAESNHIDDDLDARAFEEAEAAHQAQQLHDAEIAASRRKMAEIAFAEKVAKAQNAEEQAHIQEQERAKAEADARAQEEIRREQAATVEQDQADDTRGPTKPNSDELERDKILRKQREDQQAAQKAAKEEEDNRNRVRRAHLAEQLANLRETYRFSWPFDIATRYFHTGTEFLELTWKLGLGDTLTLETIPWPIEKNPRDVQPSEIGYEAVEPFFAKIGESMSTHAYFKLLRLTLIRFHPDKWGRFFEIYNYDPLLRAALESAISGISKAVSSQMTEARSRM
ncbi:hypothetical protein FISHEDRAFT_71968 [Fistulina hepatica ATCC 64428]|uniref:Uncharacterized protein n=1 Tax=Fistulina hepatica ATCC 64428 TaxID=1128425 RepID=A0A0D7AJ66_9AGAR|nr:hypothetical protein FISHEDRAFT_71968 [Fistulina hepatica ATCC 64428]